MTRVLFVVSAADRWTLRDGEVHPSGFWGEELAVPHKVFTGAGGRPRSRRPAERPRPSTG